MQSILSDKVPLTATINIVLHLILQRQYTELGETVVEIPELDEKFYFKPITVVSLDKIASKIANSDISAMIDFLIRNALDQDGNRVFKMGDKSVLKIKLPFKILDKIITEAMAVPDPEDMEGN